MIIIGVDFHPEFQQIAMVDTDTGELEERRLHHPSEAEAFYRDLVSQGKTVRVGMEASGHGRWFERLLGELGIELWIGDAAEIRTKRVRKQKTDRQVSDPQLDLQLTQQPLEPAPVPTSFHSGTHGLSLAHQSAVKRFGFLRMMQSALLQLPGVGVD